MLPISPVPTGSSGRLLLRKPRGQHPLLPPISLVVPCMHVQHIYIQSTGVYRDFNNGQNLPPAQSPVLCM